MTYKEIVVLAEKRLDEVMTLPKAEIFEKEADQYIGVLLDAAGAMIFYPADNEYEGITAEDRIRLVRKSRDYCHELISYLFDTPQNYNVIHCRDYLRVFRACEKWLEKTAPDRSPAQ